MPSGKTRFSNIKDKKIRIYKSVRKKQYDEVITTWEPLTDGKLWAHYRSTSGDQYTAAKQAGYKADALFTVNWRSDIAPGMLVVYRRVIWEITRVDDLEGYKKDIKLSCEMMSQTDTGADGYPGVVLE